MECCSEGLVLSRVHVRPLVTWVRPQFGVSISTSVGEEI